MKLFKYIIPAFCAAAMLSSCSEELSGSDWSAGEPSDAPGIFFDPTMDPYVTLTASDNVVLDIEIYRINNQGELTVPIIVKQADPNMVIPATVTFADGADKTTLAIGCTDAARAEELPLVLTFPQEYINPYAAGGSTLESTVMISNWEEVTTDDETSEGVTFNIVDWGFKDAGFQPIVSKMYHFVGSNRYRIENFLGSGFDFNFELVQSPLRSTRHRIVPLSNQLLLADYPDYGWEGYYHDWWLVADNWQEDEDNAWPELIFNYADGREYPFYYIEFLWYDEATKSEYSYAINYERGDVTCYMGFTGFLDADMSVYAPYYFLRFSWNEPR